MNKKGFTLVELLAVIIILAIVAIIVVPVVMDVVKKSQKNSVKTSVIGYIQAVEKLRADNMIDNDDEENILDDVYEVSELTSVEIKGDKPSEGWVKLKNGNVVDYSIKIGEYVCNPKDGEVEEPEITKNGQIATKPEGEIPNYKKRCKSDITCKAGNYIYYDPVENKKCSIPNNQTGTKTGCMKWHVIKDDGSSVDAILNHNITKQVSYNTISKYKEYAQASIKSRVESDTQGWVDGLNPRLITAEEVANATNTTTFDGSSDTHFFFNGIGDKKQTKVSTTQGDNEYAWLFDYTYNCAESGCNTTGSEDTWGYWTSSPVSDDTTSAWLIGQGGVLSFMQVTFSQVGIRPVITIQKSVIK